jgi:hypothetical protein
MQYTPESVSVKEFQEYSTIFSAFLQSIIRCAIIMGYSSAVGSTFRQYPVIWSIFIGLDDSLR